MPTYMVSITRTFELEVAAESMDAAAEAGKNWAKNVRPVISSDPNQIAFCDSYIDKVSVTKEMTSHQFEDYGL